MSVNRVCPECRAPEGALHKEGYPCHPDYYETPTSPPPVTAYSELRNLLGSLQVQESQMQASALKILVHGDDGMMREVRGALKVYASVIAGVMARLETLDERAEV